MNDVSKPDWKFLLSHPAHFLALGFGAGLLPRAPGTFGTIAAIPVYLLMVQQLDNLGYVFVTLAIVVLGFFVCGYTERAIGSHDHGSIVWDEIAGYLITMFIAPLTWWSVLTGFVLFRIFDIVKPFPISWLDRQLQGGFGTMMDDVVAGVFAWASFQFLLWVVPRFIS